MAISGSVKWATMILVSVFEASVSMHHCETLPQNQFFRFHDCYPAWNHGCLIWYTLCVLELGNVCTFHQSKSGSF